MADEIGVTLSPERLQVAPGESAETTATVRNASGDVDSENGIVEGYSVVVEGIDPEWCTLSTLSFELFPGDEEKVQITIRPPRTSAAKAGAHDIVVRVYTTSLQRPKKETTAPLVLEVGRFLEFDLDVDPKWDRGRKGSFDVIVTNNGDDVFTFKLEASDPERACNYHFKSDTVAVERGATAKVPLTVSPRRKPFTGRAKTFSFAVAATPLGGEGKTVQAKLECPPLLTRPVLLAIGGGLAAIIAAIILVPLLTGGGLAICEQVQESFNLQPGDIRVYEIRSSIRTIHAEAQWAGTADRLHLSLHRPGGDEAARLDGPDEPPLQLIIDYQIKDTDTVNGDTWEVRLVNITEHGVARGTILIECR